MSLTDVEKNGLQVYRNYSRAFETRRAAEFVQAAKSAPNAIKDLENILGLIVNEEPRTLPVVVCAYADDQLKEMFRREIPKAVPGGRSELLGGFGPLSRLSQRIQIAYAFGWLSEDVLQELDHLRQLRNDISHKWDLSVLESKLAQLIETQQHPIENYLGDGVRLPENLRDSLDSLQRFRLRLVWIAGRIAYETTYWVPALKQHLTPHQVLYGQGGLPMLAEVSALCIEKTRAGILRNES